MSGIPKSDDFFITLRELLLNADDTDAPELIRTDLVVPPPLVVGLLLRRDDIEPPRDARETSSIDVLSEEDA